MAVTTFLTPKTLWENFSADAPLKISKINEVRYDKITYGEYYFSGRDVKGESVRIFGVYATPDEKKKYSAIPRYCNTVRIINCAKLNSCTMNLLLSKVLAQKACD